MSSLAIVFLVTGMFLLPFSTYYISKKIRRSGLSGCDFEREADNKTEKGSIIILLFMVICLLLLVPSYIFYHNEVLNQRDDVLFK